MIMRFLKKIPAGMMVVPMLLGAIINTFIPEVTNIGSFTTAIFTSAGANTAIGIQLFCLGTTLRLRDMGGVVKRGGVLLISKFVIGAAIGIVVGRGVRPHRRGGPELPGHHLRRDQLQRLHLPGPDELLR